MSSQSPSVPVEETTETPQCPASVTSQMDQAMAKLTIATSPEYLRSVQIVQLADVTLKVGNSVRIHVSSGVMSAASDVFQALFKPEWFDRSSLSVHADLRPEVDLPEDDGHDIERLCWMLHFRKHKSTPPTSWEDLAGLAVVVDKYQCLHLVRDYLNKYTKKANPSKPEKTRWPDSGYYMAVAYFILNNATRFRAATHKLIRFHDRSYQEFTTAKGIDLFPANFLQVLEHRRARIRLDWFEEVSRNILTPISRMKHSSMFYALSSQPVDGTIGALLSKLEDDYGTNPNFSPGKMTTLLLEHFPEDSGPIIGKSIADGSVMMVEPDLNLCLLDCWGIHLDHPHITLAEAHGQEILEDDNTTKENNKAQEEDDPCAMS